MSTEHQGFLALGPLPFYPRQNILRSQLSRAASHSEPVRKHRAFSDPRSTSGEPAQIRRSPSGVACERLLQQYFCARPAEKTLLETSAGNADGGSCALIANQATTRARQLRPTLANIDQARITSSLSRTNASRFLHEGTEFNPRCREGLACRTASDFQQFHQSRCHRYRRCAASRWKDLETWRYSPNHLRPVDTRRVSYGVYCD